MKVTIKKDENGNQKSIISVPRGVRYISDWSEYSLSDFPGVHILNKVEPGCGYTTNCLINNLNVILVSPRRALLENKEKQHYGDVFYFRNDLADSMTNYDKDLNTKKAVGAYKIVDVIKEDISKGFTSSDDTIDRIKIERRRKREAQRSAFMEKKDRLEAELANYSTRRFINGQPLKLMVTYDSFGFLRSILEDRGMMNDFYIVVDEFQAIFTDSKFKSDSELAFLDSLAGLPRICFVSATPMIDKYLFMLDEFKNLPYFELDWVSEEPARVKCPRLRIYFIKSVVSSAKEVIDKYKSGIFESDYLLSENDPSGVGRVVQSKEAVLFVNSVSDIIKIIRCAKLKPEEVNILCANTSENIKEITGKLSRTNKSDIGEEWKIGEIPLKGELHKMFTFCTRTVYLGADFYSTNARTFVFSDANVDSLSVDITLDLPQIVGRQRLAENPWRHSADIFVKPIAKTKSEAKRICESKLIDKKELTTIMLHAYDSASDDISKKAILITYSDRARERYYKDDYVSIVFNKDESQVSPRYNNLVYVADLRCFEVQQIDYADRFSVLLTCENPGPGGRSFQVTSFEKDKRERWQNTKFGNFSDRLRDYDNSPDYTDEEKKNWASEISPRFGIYMNVLTKSQRFSCGYNVTKMDNLIKSADILSSNVLDDSIKSAFKIGDRISLKKIKRKLCDIYLSLGLDFTKEKIEKPNATILSNYFVLKKTKVIEDGIRVHAFEIISEK